MVKDTARRLGRLPRCRGRAGRLELEAPLGVVPAFRRVLQILPPALAESLAHPGGNVTGLTLTTRGQAGKRLQLLQEAAPSISRVAFFYFLGSPRDLADLAEAQEAAVALKLTLLPLPVSYPTDFPLAFAQALAQGADGASFHAGTIGSCCVPQIVGFRPSQRLVATFLVGR
jgi:putative tryptophan/tyrosine transport system substrate-binding protein